MFAIPTLDDLTARARSAFRAYLPGSDAWVWPNNVGPSAKVIAGMTHEVFGFADAIAQDKFAGTAQGEGLDRHGAEIGLAREPAAAAEGNVILTTSDGVTVAAGALFQRSDGVQYTATAPASSASAGTLNVPVAATTTGSSTDAIADTPLAILSGLADPNGDATAAVDSNGLTGGADVEQDGPPWTSDLSFFRGRILFRKRNPPQGGAPSDYVLWASGVPGVTRVFVERLWAGNGSVRIFPLMDDTYSNGIPQSGDINRIANYIGALAPAGAAFTVQAPSPIVVNPTISGLSPSNTVIQSAVAQELAAAFRRLSAVAGNDSGVGGMPFLAVPFSFARIWIEQAIANATGVSRATLSSPGGDVALAAGQIATLGTVSFI
jgi:uncharacterized phage protein gp47/JayE